MKSIGFGERLRKHAATNSSVWNWLFFIGGVALAGMTSLSELPGGLFPDKCVMLAMRFFVIVALFYVLSFRTRTFGFAVTHTSWWETLISAGFAAYQGTRIGLFFHNVFVRNLGEGRSPVIAQRVFDAIPVSSGIKIALINAAVVLLTLTVLYALFVFTLCIVRLLKESFRETFRNPDYPDPTDTLPLGRRILIGAALACVTAVLSFLILNKGQDWGADYTGYIEQAIDLATGHTERICIVWGYGAMLLPIYQIFGFDRVDFSSVIYYKIPGVVCFTLLVFFLFLFFSKRFKAFYAVALTSVFGLSPLFLTFTNQILTNLPHLLFSTLSIMLLYKLFEEKSLAKSIVAALLAGICIAISDLIRVNGIILVLTLACVHVILLISMLLRKNRYFAGLNERMPVRHVAVHAIPYVVYFLLVKIINALVFRNGAGIGVQDAGLTVGASTLTSILAGNGLHHITLDWFFDSIHYYWALLTGFVSELAPFGIFESMANFLLLPLVLIGIIRSFRKELLSVVYFFGMLAMLCVIVYRQGLQYTFPILPMLVLFLAVGVKTFADVAGVTTKRPDFVRGLLRAGAVLLCASFLLGTGYHAVKNMQAHRVFNLYSYSEDAKDVYRYIQNQTDPDAVIVFVKPGVIMLNAERDSLSVIPAKVERDTYLLITSEAPREHQMTDPMEYGSLQNIETETGFTLSLVYENPRFQLYRIQG